MKTVQSSWTVRSLSADEKVYRFSGPFYHAHSRVLTHPSGGSYSPSAIVPPCDGEIDYCLEYSQMVPPNQSIPYVDFLKRQAISESISSTHKADLVETSSSSAWNYWALAYQEMVHIVWTVVFSHIFMHSSRPSNFWPMMDVLDIGWAALLDYFWP